MWFIELLYFIPASVIYLGIAFLGLSYLYMGIVQLATGGWQDESPEKRSGGFVSLLISLAVLGLSSYAYFKFIWLW